MSEGVHALVVPRVNVNDDAVRLVQWFVEAGATVAVGELVCLVETSKAAEEIEAHTAGVIVPMAAVDEMVDVGAPLAMIASTIEAAESARQAVVARPSQQRREPAVRATPKAVALARARGVTLEAVSAAGVTGTIKERDVERYLAGSARTAGVAEAGRQEPPTLPAALMSRLLPPEPLTRHDLAMIDGLQTSVRNVILTTLDYEIQLGDITARITDVQKSGAKLSLQQVVITAIGRTLPEFKRLMTVRAGAERYTYRDVDIAFIVRSLDGRLFAPVVRRVDTLDTVAVARACAAAAMRVYRGDVSAEELDGACFTLSQIADPGVVRFVALPNRYQSAVLAMGGERGTSSAPVVNVTLSYDHALCDGSYVASFLTALSASMRDCLG